jgi:hypothetical protein
MKKHHRKIRMRPIRRWHEDHDITPIELEDLPIAGINPGYTLCSPLFGPGFDRGEDGAA